MNIEVTEKELGLLLSGLDMLGEYLDEDDQVAFNTLYPKINRVRTTKEMTIVIYGSQGSGKSAVQEAMRIRFPETKIVTTNDSNFLKYVKTEDF